MARAVLSLADPRVRAFVRTDERLRAAKVVGKGKFCRVYETPDPNRVLKLIADYAHVYYLVDRLSPQGIFKPIVHEDYSVVCTTADGVDVQLLEVERLQKVRRGTPNGRLVRRILDFAQHYSWLPTHREWWLPKDLGEFMQEVNEFSINFDCKLDLHWANFMERPDGTLILNDPVLDYRTFSRFAH